jgi:hypothetical protein
VNFEKKAAAKKIKKYMFFKTALSLYRYEKPIKMVKAFILDTAKKRLPSRVAVCIK